METQTMPFNEFLKWLGEMEELPIPDGYMMCPVASLSPPYVNCWLLTDVQVADLKQRSEV
jgi:hypothetical protein